MSVNGPYAWTFRNHLHMPCTVGPLGFQEPLGPRRGPPAPGAPRGVIMSKQGRNKSSSWGQAGRSRRGTSAGGSSAASEELLYQQAEYLHLEPPREPRPREASEVWQGTEQNWWTLRLVRRQT